MPPRRSIGARKKIAKTTTRAAARKTAASKAVAAAAVAAETAPDETDAEVPLEETAGETLPDETAAQNSADKARAAVVPEAVDASGASPVRESLPVTTEEGQSGNPVTESDVVAGSSKEVPKVAVSCVAASVEEGDWSIAKTPEETKITTKSPAARTPRGVVRKVTRKVPVRVCRNKGASAAVEKEIGGQEPVLPASVEKNEKPNETEAIIAEPVEEKNLDHIPEELSQSQRPVLHGESVVSSVKTCAEEIPPVAAPQKIVRKVKRIVVVKKYVKKPKVQQENEKLGETEGTARGGISISGNDAKPNSSTAQTGSDLKAEAASAADGVPTEDDNIMPRNEADKGEGAGTSGGDAGDEMMGMSESQKRRKTEIFVGGLDKNAKEDDLKKVFGKVGEIVEVRMMIDAKTGKNKGYAFIRYATAAQAKQAVAEFSKVEVCGKQCGAAALQVNDTLFLGNIDKKWKKDDITRILQELGIDKIDSLTLMIDPKEPSCNRGFAFIDFETNKDAQIAFKKLQRKDAFGKGHMVKVAWAEPFNVPDEEEMQKVKSVFAEGIPLSWDENQVRECFAKYGEIERVVLSRNMVSAKRRDFAFVNFISREAALSCIESFDKDSSSNATQVGLKVSLAKPMNKGKKSKTGPRTNERDDSFKSRHPMVQPQFSRLQGGTKAKNSSKGQKPKGLHVNIREDKGSAYREFLHVPREHTSWSQMNYSRGHDAPEYGNSSHGGKRPLSSLGESAIYTDPRAYPRSRMDIPYHVASPSSFPHSAPLDYYHRPSHHQYGMGSSYGGTFDSSFQFPPQARTGNAPPYRARPYPR